MAQSSFAKRGMIYVLALTSLAGCSSISSMLEPSRIDYKSEVKKTPTLEIPPDLTQLQRENRYTLPDANRGTATASAYNAQQGARPAEQAATVAPKALSDVRVERDGSQRWLVVNQTPEALWPQIKDFWQDNGFLINLEAPQSGVMETDWAENRAKIPQDFIRNSLGKIFDSLYSTGERDKFRTRLERRGDGATEIYVSHRGAEEVLTGTDKETTVWTARPSDPDLEAEFLSRLMVQLGVEGTRAKAAVANVVAQSSRAKLVKNTAGNYVQVEESFDRAWRRVGLALDRVGFTVEDRDRTQGLYFVRYVDQGDDAKTTEKKGFFGNLFTFGSKAEKDKAAAKYRVSVKGTADSSRISVLNNEGKPEVSKTGEKILTLLNEQLK
ncbi:outer membrane protein assembly factor BamC [Herminiimonas sp. NPDC097707]|uniref:Lipoprotein n=1 Tax=Herminiimonas arsenicoxydans TaxID=204773 RepID=A4G723_HERAR|nr:putative lipoprotein [Herminiimonas arsenicoxydans]